MAHHTEEFPYEEHRDPVTGDYFSSVRDALEAGFELNQIWSVAESDGTFCYGPPHHFVNVLGFVATKETHDNDTYYEEPEDG